MGMAVDMGTDMGVVITKVLRNCSLSSLCGICVGQEICETTFCCTLLWKCNFVLNKKTVLLMIFLYMHANCKAPDLKSFFFVMLKESNQTRRQIYHNRSTHYRLQINPCPVWVGGDFLPVTKLSAALRASSLCIAIFLLEAKKTLKNVQKSSHLQF